MSDERGGRVDHGGLDPGGTSSSPLPNLMDDDLDGFGFSPLSTDVERELCITQNLLGMDADFSNWNKLEKDKIKKINCSYNNLTSLPEKSK